MKCLKCINLTLALLMIFMLNTAVAEENFKLTMQVIYGPTQTIFTDVYLPFAKELEKRSNGTLKLEVFPSGALVPYFQECSAVKNGSIDIGLCIVSSVSEAPYSMFYASIPYQFKSMDKIMINSAGQILGIPGGNLGLPEIAAEIEQYGKNFGSTYGLPLALASIKQAIRIPSDLKGKRVLIPASTLSPIVQAWGGVPVVIDAGDAYLGLQRGMGEVYLTGFATLKSQKIHEIAKYMTRVGSPMGSASAIVFNHDIWNELSPKQQEIFEETAKEYFLPIQEASWSADLKESIDVIQKNGVEIIELSPEEENLWVTAAQPTVDAGIERAKKAGKIKNVDEFVVKAYANIDAYNKWWNEQQVQE